MNSPRVDLTPYVEYETRRCSDVVRTWVGAQRLVHNVERWLGESVATWSSTKDAAGAWAEITLDADRCMLCRAHPTRDSRPYPWIQIVSRNFDMNTDADVDLVRAKVSERFEDHRGIGYFEHGSEPGMPRGVEPYKRYLAASLEALKALPEPGKASQFTAERATDLSFFDTYREEYRRWHETSPALAEVVPVEPYEAMDRYLADDGLVLLREQGALVGVIAAARESEYGLSGWCIHERFHFRAFRNRGFGRAVLWRFAQVLAYEPGDVLWGFIVPHNHASLRTAGRLGRTDIGGLMWIATDSQV